MQIYAINVKKNTSHFWKKHILSFWCYIIAALCNQSLKIWHILKTSLKKSTTFAVLLQNNEFTQSFAENIMCFGNKSCKKSTSFAIVMQNNRKFMWSVVKNIRHLGNKSKKKIVIFLQNKCEFMQVVVENIMHFRKKCEFCLEIIVSLCNQSGKSITFWRALTLKIIALAVNCKKRWKFCLFVMK